MVRLIRQILKPDWQPRRVCFEHPAPRDLSTHHRFFGPCVEFDYDFNCIICAKADLDARNPSADPAMVRYAQQLLDTSVMSQQTTMLEDVRRAILLLLPSGHCGVEQVAEHMGLVCRTVQRRLAEQGQSFSSIVNDLRKELATRHVIESDRPLTEVATLLGFSAPSAFSRWYHTQFGCSAKDSRAAGRSEYRGGTGVDADPPAHPAALNHSCAGRSRHEQFAIPTSLIRPLRVPAVPTPDEPDPEREAISRIVPVMAGT